MSSGRTRLTTSTWSALALRLTTASSTWRRDDLSQSADDSTGPSGLLRTAVSARASRSSLRTSSSSRTVGSPGRARQAARAAPRTLPRAPPRRPPLPPEKTTPSSVEAGGGQQLAADVHPPQPQSRVASRKITERPRLFSRGRSIRSQLANYLDHGLGSHKLNNALGQALLARR